MNEDTASTATSGQPLTGIKVLELAGGVASAYAGKLFSDYGAEVIKVEPPATGDATRAYPPFLHDGVGTEHSALFLHLNTSKASISLNLSKPGGQAILRRILPTADIVIESHIPGTLDEWGLGFDCLRALQPKIVLTSVTPFGQTGPYAQYRGEDLIVFAMGGMNTQGALGQPPLKLSGYHVQYHAGTVAATATLSALLMAESAGEAVHVDVSMLEVQNGAIDGRRPALVSYQYMGRNVKRESAPTVTTIPSSIFPASDGYVQIMTIPAHVDRMLATLQSHELYDLFSSGSEVPADTSTKDLVDAFLLPWLLDRSRDEAMLEAQANRWAVTSFNTPTDVVSDRHFLERGFFVDVDHPAVGRVGHLGAPFRMENGWKIRRCAPALGEDNKRIYGRELDLSDNELADLRISGII